ncbi:unnamed protein product [Dicrocoelium dendriticum]|nr:unnamed protein product [Dicrocoelium dendriticum]
MPQRSAPSHVNVFSQPSIQKTLTDTKFEVKSYIPLDQAIAWAPLFFFHSQPGHNNNTRRNSQGANMRNTGPSHRSMVRDITVRSSLLYLPAPKTRYRRRSLAKL